MLIFADQDTFSCRTHGEESSTLRRRAPLHFPSFNPELESPLNFMRPGSPGLHASNNPGVSRSRPMMHLQSTELWMLLLVQVSLKG